MLPDAGRILLTRIPSGQHVHAVRKPIGRLGLKILGQGHGVGFTRIDLPEKEPARVGERKIFSVGRNHAVGHLVLGSIRGQSPLAQDLGR
jgi:hypothetical protein